MSSKDYYASLWDTAEELNRNDCFNDLAYRNMTFDRDDRPEHLLSKAARAYAENFQPALEQHGIMFTGNVGTGKTFYACCIANAVIDRGCTAWVTTLQPLVRALCSYEAAEKILAKIRKVRPGRPRLHGAERFYHRQAFRDSGRALPLRQAAYRHD